MLQARDSLGVGEKDKLLFLQSADNTCRSFATSAAEFQVSIDIALLAQVRFDPSVEIMCGGNMMIWCAEPSRTSHCS